MSKSKADFADNLVVALVSYLLAMCIMSAIISTHDSSHCLDILFNMLHGIVAQGYNAR